jgi:ABC-type multidrug transport system fused ATPase/permease subunit
VSLSLMFSLDARLTLQALIPLPFVSVAVKLFGTAIHRRSSTSRQSSRT